MLAWESPRHYSTNISDMATSTVVNLSNFSEKVKAMRGRKEGVVESLTAQNVIKCNHANVV
jgi:hypothetical protein